MLSNIVDFLLNKENDPLVVLNLHESHAAHKLDLCDICMSIIDSKPSHEKSILIPNPATIRFRLWNYSTYSLNGYNSLQLCSKHFNKEKIRYVFPENLSNLQGNLDSETRSMIPSLTTLSLCKVLHFVPDKMENLDFYRNSFENDNFISYVLKFPNRYFQRSFDRNVKYQKPLERFIDINKRFLIPSQFIQLGMKDSFESSESLPDHIPRLYNCTNDEIRSKQEISVQLNPVYDQNSPNLPWAINFSKLKNLYMKYLDLPYDPKPNAIHNHPFYFKQSAIQIKDDKDISPDTWQHKIAKNSRSDKLITVPILDQANYVYTRTQKNPGPQDPFVTIFWKRYSDNKIVIIQRYTPILPL